MAKLVWNLLDALLVVMVINCGYSLLLFWNYQSETDHLDAQLQKGLQESKVVDDGANALVKDVLIYSKDDPGVLEVFRLHDIKPR